MNDQELLFLTLSLARFGDINKLDVYHDPQIFLNDISIFEDKWVKYNPFKPDIPRFGLSITSIDGGMTGIPDLTSLREYNSKNNTLYNEVNFTIPTPVYQFALPYFNFIKDYIFRTHVLRLPPGGFFPIHRDNGVGLTQSSFRLLVPLKNCNPPTLFFMIGENYDIVTWNHGSVYFVNTSKQHILFNASATSTSSMIVINANMTDDAVKKVLSNFSVK